MSFRVVARAHESTAPSRRWAALAFLSLLQLLIAVDVTVVTVALPAIGADFAATTGQLTWVVTGYTVVGGGLLLLGGRLADLLGRRRLFLLGALVFGLASLGAGLAPNLEVLVLARFAQGAGEAMASPAAMSLIALLFPGAGERARALGVWGAISSSGLVVGVLLSGVIVNFADWRLIFLINPPLVLAVLIAATVLLRPETPPVRDSRLDLAGALLLTLTPLLLVFGVVELDHAGAAAPTTWLPLACAPLTAAAFVVLQRRRAHPLVPLGLLAHRVRLVANAATVLLSAALSTTFFLLTFYLQQVLEFDALQTGLAYLPLCVALLLAVTQVSRLIAGVGTTMTALLGLAVTAAGVCWLARIPVDGSYLVDVLPAMVAVAVGMGVGLVALQNAALADVTEQDAGIASGVQRSVDQLGGAVGLSVLVGLLAGTTSGGDAARVAAYSGAFWVALAGLVVAGLAVALLGPRKGR